MQFKKSVSRSSAIFAFLALVLAGMHLSTPAPALAAGPYEEGDTVVITGVVTDAQGLPIEGLRVAFRASRKAFNVKRLRRTQDEPTVVAGDTNAHGEYEVHWPWHAYYNRFELVAGIYVRQATGERLQILASDNLSKRILQGSPVISNLVVEDTSFLESIRRFLADLQSEDEKVVYEQMGRPNKVEKFGSESQTEVTWWYFRAGRAYRFVQGDLQRVIHFDPVTPITDEADS